MFREMSETEVIIRSIDNVRMISIYELTGVGDEPERSCAAISVFYDRDKYINLCEFDDGFDILADRVFEIYGDIGDKSSVAVDDRTRNILESGWLKRDESFLEKYYEMQPSDVPEIAFEAAATGKLLPMVEYLLDSLYRVLGIKYEITDSRVGWRGTGTVFGMKNDKRIVSGISILQNTKEEYEVHINNFVETGNVLNVIVYMRNAGIIVEYFCNSLDIRGTGVYTLEPGGYTEFYETYRDGKIIFRDSREVFNAEPVVLDDEEKLLIPWDTEETGIALPWGTVYFMKCERKEENSCVIEEYRECFIFRRAHLGESRCWTRVQNNTTKFSLKTSSVVMYIMALRKGGLQVHFLPNIGNHKARYRQLLEGRYFLINRQKIQDGE